MNVLFLDQFSELGGAQLCLCDLLPFVIERGWDVRLAVQGDGPLSDAFRTANASVHQLHGRCYSNGRKSASDVVRFGYDFARDAVTIRDLVRRHSIDLVYVNGPRLLPAVVYCGTTVVFHAHSYVEKPYALATVRWAVRQSGAQVIACSQFVAASLARQLRHTRVHTIYNGVRDQASSGGRKPRTGVRVGMIGRIAPDKGQTDFVSAAGLVRSSHPDATFSIFGAALFGNTDYERSVRAVAESLNVDLCGWVDDVSAALSDLDMLVVPSRCAEACPRIILEALAAGVPVIAYRCGGIPELIGEGIGVLVEPGDVQGLAAAIRWLIEHPQVRDRLARCGRSAWRQRFTLERFGREVCDVMAQCASVSAPGHRCSGATAGPAT